MRISDWSSDVCSSDLRDAGIGAAAHRHAEPLAVEIAHDADEAAILRPDQIFGGNADAVEMNRSGVAAPPPHLVESCAGGAGAVHVDEEQRDARGTRSAGADRKSTRLNSSH